MRRLILVVALGPFTTLSYGELTLMPVVIASCHQLKGYWVNDKGARINIRSTEGGQLIGTYFTPERVGNYRYRIQGVTNSKKAKAQDDNVIVISFAVQWKTLGSLTSWTGYCRTIGNTSEMKLITHDVKPNARTDNEHMHTYYEQFTPEK